MINKTLNKYAHADFMTSIPSFFRREQDRSSTGPGRSGRREPNGSKRRLAQNTNHASTCRPMPGVGATVTRESQQGHGLVGSALRREKSGESF
jgi:hypothetical protein